MNHSINSYDKEYIAELMAAFPVHETLSPDQALDLVSTRFDRLNTESFIKTLQTLDEQAYSKRLVQLPCLLHRYLFFSIISNAGEYRKAQDPEGGRVYFGPGQCYRGSPTQLIDGEVRKALACLPKESNDPIYNAVKFYQLFVFAHPFYDANGRIGRFLFETYLNMHEIVMQWDKLNENEGWIRKLNQCHKRVDSHNYEQYLQYLVSHWRKCTFKIPEMIPYAKN